MTLFGVYLFSGSESCTNSYHFFIVAKALVVIQIYILLGSKYQLGGLQLASNDHMAKKFIDLKEKIYCTCAIINRGYYSTRLKTL